MSKRERQDKELCPCGRPAGYAQCCGRLHTREATAGTPEELMRSRYSAFALRDVDYLLRTWHPDTRPAELRPDPARTWLRLDVLGSSDGGPFGTEGFVEFRAHYAEPGGVGSLHERSRFVRHRGAWVYVDGETD
ncbi:MULTISPECIES: YchJ family protein [unclassified Streptomyces]|uniref:YchJ family protein n=1 Tax=unclassified Streptomyces TaxID=2593676 RepID=UPI0022B6BCBE|nr:MULTISPECIES: YchJ family metal-binding protein [unclassified Streptomyces]MCZ7417019.1 YchJ family metal-binding protein [Streptomyces sp. WMMC897]MCZ7433153.1 YchJ family metal-binding protein [Streptomyces sp. WMMC1477]